MHLKWNESNNVAFETTTTAATTTTVATATTAITTTATTATSATAATAITIIVMFVWAKHNMFWEGIISWRSPRSMQKTLIWVLQSRFVFFVYERLFRTKSFSFYICGILYVCDSARKWYLYLIFGKAKIVRSVLGRYSQNFAE